ncbi:PREDICTED: alpha-tocopherol transfer protein-like [Nicrophorus vespilloides]|uniref:Alpha-tocopherol transfer protein-like n=1 Tax=Nicrophorus vespilloides TaxID=110193 RepID=A0ABM1MRR2_NICVS|nr:PREDICTED: alpha-tocopherol transfer protein-like [Nicrophorus vespilloides]XP_017777264.1 PREDICTED: alpha-tocopherol transfer protein-like [Nicrophorus vespilloides]
METVRFGFKAEDVIAEGRTTREEIEELRRMLVDVNVPELTDEQIVLFILSCDRDLKFTVTTVKEYYSARKNGPELFSNRDLERPDLQYQLDVIEYSIFPERTDDGCAVLFHRLHDTYFSHYQMEQSMKLLFMTLDSAVFDHPPTGLVILFDMKGVGLMHLTRIKLGALRKFCHYLQEGLPVKLKEIHVLNTAYFIDKLMAIIKPLMKKEILEQLHFHAPSADMDMFYQNYLPKKCMPSDFGGDLPDVRELHCANTKKLREMQTHFESEERQRSNYYQKQK